MGDDYHAVVRRHLRELWKSLDEAFPGVQGRTFVDTGPVLEREVAARAGLGWIGKNTLLINRTYGSYVFLAEAITTLDLAPDLPAAAHCGTCTRCLDACPTDAFPEPHVLDSSRCISYLTIEHRGPIALAAGIGNLVYGCDICQQVCPWNAKAPSSIDPVFQPRPERNPIDLIALATMDDAGYAALTERSAMKRPKRTGLRRNATIALGNALRVSEDPGLRRTLEELREDPDPVVRDAARQAVDRID
ncbi:MAG TPA: tRNA epoxyqueuosine(34) reductase QueG [bacterium]|nr:tRNA epoxyqueuosine(34) reductase QueG [bacterium]